MGKSGKRQRRLSDGYSFAGLRAGAAVRGVFGAPEYGSCALIGAQKNGVRVLRARPEGVVWPALAAGPRSAERRVSDCSGSGGAAPRLSALRRREARTAGFPGGQRALDQTLCVLRRPPLPAGLDPRCRQGAQARLGHGQDPRDAVYARPARACRHARPRERSASTRSRSAGATAIASWSATSSASGRSGSAARIVPRPAWRRSTTPWEAKRAAKPGLPSWTCGSRCAPSRKRGHRKPRSCSTNSTSCAISARRSIACARANMRGCPGKPPLHRGPEVHAALAQ
jgi:hypothetical protein